jgi:hypothetical protein
MKNNLYRKVGRDYSTVSMSLTRLKPVLLLFMMYELIAPVYGFAGTSSSEATVVGIGAMLPLWSVLPFMGILFSIALMPLIVPHFWHHHFPKVSAFWALVLAIPFIYFFRDVAVYEIAHIFIIDYIPFIILLWALFAVSGGIYVKGSLKGSPAVNAAILLIGTILASIIKFLART